MDPDSLTQRAEQQSFAVSHVGLPTGVQKNESPAASKPFRKTTSTCPAWTARRAALFCVGRASDVSHARGPYSPHCASKFVNVFVPQLLRYDMMSGQ
jgi:hypothetical protein